MLNNMLRILFFLVFLASYASCADHEAFKNCSRVPFCNSMRNAKPTSALIAQLLDLSITKNSVSIPISNDKQKFNIQVVLLNKHTARVNILENDSTRYELKDVLDKEPTQLEVTVDKSVDNQVTIKPVNSEYSHSVLVEADPLKIKFYHGDGTLQSVFNGDNVIFDTDSQSFAFEVEFINAIKLYGLHHHAADLELPDTQETKIDPFRLRNSDIANYEVGSPMAMYGAVPAVYGHTGIYTSGIFLHNAAEQWIDISYGAASASAKFMVESAALDLFVFLGNTTKEVVRQFVEITGRAHMPQLWTLGYHQCRWSYFTQEDAQEVVAQMDTHDLPMDGIWLDIDYTNGYRYFTWNPENYSDPIAFQKNISSTNRKIVTILDPHIKVDEDYPVYANAKGKYFVKKENGKDDFEGSCWPGVSSYLDFLNPEARDYYASWYSYDKFKNTTSTIAGVWNDMNEPSVFDTTTENTMPFDAVHYGNVAHRDIHNIYGFLQTKATHQGLMQRDNGTKRPFILTRSHFAGSQRYSAMWTGDNTADWPYLRVSYSECILSNLMGLVFCGADVGGFFGDPEVELVERWYQAGIWLPFYRGHAHLDSKRREPYLYNSTVRDVIRTALRTRYKHVPVWYTLFYEHVRNGDPVIRPLFYDYPDLVSKDNHIMLGSDILARPVMEKGATSIDVTFPGEANNYWYRDDNSFELFTGGATKTLPVDIETSPYFYKGGSIIARRDTVRRSTSDALKDPYSIYVNLDANNEASGRLYVDDYTSFAYQDDKIFCYLNISYFDDTGGVHVELIDGTCINIGIEFSHIIIHRKSPKNEKKYTRTEITTLSEGTPLKDFKLGPALNKQKKLVLKL